MAQLHSESEPVMVTPPQLYHGQVMLRKSVMPFTKWSENFEQSGRQRAVHRQKRVAKRVEDLKQTQKNWKMPESYTKTLKKPLPRFAKLRV